MSNQNDIQHKFFTVRASAFDDDHKVIHGHGHVCLTLKQTERNRNKYRVGFSFKSPADKLDRERGLKIAQGRLMCTRPARNITIEASSPEEAFTTALDKLLAKQKKVFRRGKEITRPFVPDWLYEAVNVKNRRLVALKG